MTHPGKARTERISLLGPRSELTGNFTTTEELVILGRLDGQCVTSPNITIGPAARVRAQLRAGQIRIEGVVIGDIHAETAVVIHASATVHGSVHSPQITIQEGAIVNGAINQGAAPTRRERDTDQRKMRSLAVNSQR
jgi:cytoskeletal protein CcmA (bactofilin family)